MSRRPETPVRPSVNTHSEIKTLHVSEVQEAVRRDLNNLVYLTETKPFIQRIFRNRFRGDAQKIFDALEKDKFYFNGRWAKFPTGDHLEDKVYEPLVDLCNAIARIDDHNDGVSARWFDRHSNPPKANYETQARSRPDCMFATETQAVKNFDQEQAELEKQKDKLSEEDKSKAKKKLKRKLHILWMHVLSIIEIKLRNISDNDTFYQLFTYQRQALTEQLDRRFILGFVLCGEELQAVLCDRSGIQVTQTSINIHQQPLVFIEIVGALSQMTPEQLGWDTSMKIYSLSTLQEIPSYNVEADFVVEDDRYHTYWTIDVAQKAGVEKYVSVSILSAARSGDICSRATLVFEVVRYNERFNPSEILVLKRYWRPAVESSSDDAPYPTEGRYYEFLEARDPKGVPKRIHSYGDIHVRNEEGKLMVDSTFNTIRLGLSVSEASFSRNATGQGKSRRRDEQGNDAELGLYFVTQEEQNHMGRVLGIPAARMPIDRIHTDILVPRGVVIRLFSDLIELLQCLSACLGDLKICTEEGIVHRDASSGNLLIMSEDNTIGRMSDFDHAKKTYLFDTFYPPSSPIQNNFAKGKMKTFLSQKDLSTDVDRLVEDMAQAMTDTLVLSYIERLQSTEASAGLRLLSDEILMKKWPDFSDYNGKPGKRIGTVPFMAGEVIASSYILHPSYRTQKQVETSSKFFSHNPAHDVESCLWVLIHICLTRDGPGTNAYRDEHLTETQPSSVPIGGNEDAPWRQIVRTYFDGDAHAIGAAKRDLYMESNGRSIRQITEQFHEYFQPLGPLVEKWWELIVFAHTYHAREYLNIHSLSRLLIDDTIKSLQQQSLTVHPKTNEVKEYRTSQKKQLLETFSKARRDLITSKPTRSAASSGFETPSKSKRFKSDIVEHGESMDEMDESMD